MSGEVCSVSQLTSVLQARLMSTGSPRLKNSLLLTYDYLRLYVNAFAYQATISRALTLQRDTQNSAIRQAMPLINATATDARFIYEALDAAKSLLNTFNESVEPQTLRYMPSCYYLFIIYSAVFLYKARSTTTMTDEERTGVRRMISHTIDRLQKASTGAGHMGSRYARLLQLLWRKAPKPNATATATSLAHKQSLSHQPYNNQHTQPSSFPHQQPYAQNPNLVGLSPISSYQPQQSHLQQPPQYTSTPPLLQQYGSPDISSFPHPSSQQPPQNRAFSWLDLGATWNFATQNNGSGSNSGSMGELEMDDEVGGLWGAGSGPGEMGMDMGVGMGGGMGLVVDYSVLEGDNPELIF